MPSPRTYRLVFLACLLLTAPSIALSQRTPAPAPAAANAPNAERPATPVPPEKSSVTEHDSSLGGKTLRYTATAGNLLINGDDAQPNASVFYVAYTLNGVTDPRTRPVTFLYNGGPGSATVPLHMASVGPVRVVTSSPAATGSGPYEIVPNEYSLLDRSDLVFIDAVGTGYSRPVGKGVIRDFAGTDQDVRAFEKFIYRYVSVNHRWNSPKFLFGESYGTTRSAALVDTLENSGMSMNGVILMSSILNYFTRAPGLDAVFVGYLPSYCRDCRGISKRSRTKAKTKKPFLDEVRAFRARSVCGGALSRPGA